MASGDYPISDYSSHWEVVDHHVWDTPSPFPAPSYHEWQPHSNFYGECENFQEPSPYNYHGAVSPSPSYYLD